MVGVEPLVQLVADGFAVVVVGNDETSNICYIFIASSEHAAACGTISR